MKKISLGLFVVAVVYGIAFFCGSSSAVFYGNPGIPKTRPRRA